MEQRIDLEHKLNLILSPATYLYLELLQLPIQKLEEHVKRELEENPCLEEEEKEEFSFIYENLSFSFHEGEEEREVPVPERESLREVLIRQACCELDGMDLEIAKFIIDNLDNRGFLLLSVKEISEILKVEPGEVERVREYIKTLNPVGCASYSVIEAFEVQLKEKGFSSKYLNALKYLSLLLESKEKFRKEVGFSEDELENFLSLLKRLDPEPGNLGENSLRIVPDLKVLVEGEKVKVEVYSPFLLKFRVNSFYLKYADREEVKRYIKEKYQRALNLQKAIKKREDTLKSVGRVIFEKQKSFLKDGNTLHPLSYREVAEVLKIHESTVARAVKDKFVETPFGVYPLKFFFKKGVSGVSSEAVKEKIKEIIEREDKRKPLSDQMIASELKKLGIKVARRTVAKYREELGIPSAFKRRIR